MLKEKPILNNVIQHYQNNKMTRLEISFVSGRCLGARVMNGCRQGIRGSTGQHLHLDCQSDYLTIRVIKPQTAEREVTVNF